MTFYLVRTNILLPFFEHFAASQLAFRVKHTVPPVVQGEDLQLNEDWAIDYKNNIIRIFDNWWATISIHIVKQC